jgi:uncharacterized protein YpmB
MDNHTATAELRDKVLEMIQKTPTEPQKIVKKLLDEGISEDMARTVMSELIDRNAIIFTRDWRIQINPLASAAA